MRPPRFAGLKLRQGRGSSARGRMVVKKRLKGERSVVSGGMRSCAI